MTFARISTSIVNEIFGLNQQGKDPAEIARVLNLKNAGFRKYLHTNVSRGAPLLKKNLRRERRNQ